MKQALKILLWTGSILGGMAGVNLLGLAIFAPAMLSASVGLGIGQKLFAQQVLGVLDGQSGILKLASVCVLLTILDKGTARLEDSVLLARYGALSEVMETANEATCEAIAGGTAQAGVMEALLGKIRDGAQASFLDSQYRAAKAELQQVKPLVLSKDETAIARERFLVTFDDKDLARLQREVRPNSGAARDRSCWMARKDLAAVELLDEPYKRMWARTLNQQ